MAQSRNISIAQNVSKALTGIHCIDAFFRSEGTLSWWPKTIGLQILYNFFGLVIVSLAVLGREECATTVHDAYLA